MEISDREIIITADVNILNLNLEKPWEFFDFINKKPLMRASKGIYKGLKILDRSSCEILFINCRSFLHTNLKLFSFVIFFFI